MRRRSFLATLTAGATVSLSGCAEGDVVLEVQKSINVDAGMGWVQKIDSVDGAGSLSFEIRSEDQRFQVFYFTDESEYDQYEAFLANDDTGEQPEGHSELSGSAVFNEERGAYEVVEPNGGGRHSLEIQNTHYLVVDHSNYGVGVPVAEHDDPLSANVEIRVLKKHLPF